MPLITWENKFSVGVKELDNQHKKLIELINELYDSMRAGHGKDVLKQILNDLLEYTKYHFDTEEKYFIKYNYYGKTEHMKEHAELKEKVMDLKQKVDGGKAVISNEILQFLKNWLSTHIMESDKRYSSFFNDKGLN
jgi:hemerythrin-like metal-binding protein